MPLSSPAVVCLCFDVRSETATRYLGLSAGSSPGGGNSVLLAALKIEMAAMLAPLAEDVRSLKAQLSKGR